MNYELGRNIKGLYKYVYNDNIIYIGKSEKDILGRLKCHEEEEKFKKYLGGAYIYYAEMQNNVEINALESLMINKYKPVLNIVDNNDITPTVEFNEPSDWILCKSGTKYIKEMEHLTHLLEFLEGEKDQKIREREQLEHFLESIDDIKKFFDKKEMSCFVTNHAYSIAPYVSLTEYMPLMRDRPIKKIIFTNETSNAHGYEIAVDITLSKKLINIISDKKEFEVFKEKVSDRLAECNNMKYFHYNLMESLRKMIFELERGNRNFDLEDLGWMLLRAFDLRDMWEPECCNPILKKIANFEEVA